MRRNLVIGFGLAGVLAGSAAAQLPTGGPPARAGAPGLPAGFEPVDPAAPGGTLPAGYSALPAPAGPRPLAPPPPVDLEIRTAVPADHEWLLKPEHGAYFISVKSYSRPSRPTPDDQGPSALAMAEALAAEIRNTYRVQAFLYELVSEERRAEAAALAAARVRGREFAAQWDRLREKAQLQGMEFLEPDNKVRFKTVNYKDQVAVLVGGFQSDEAARKALDTVRKWKLPEATVKDRLGRDIPVVDCGTVLRPGPNGKQQAMDTPINPYLTATVVPNPTAPRRVESGAAGLDPFIVKLNEGRPYNLLGAKKAWTLGVKSFCAPVEIVAGNAGNSVMRKLGGGRGGDALAAGAEQAESLAKALREMRGPGAPGQPGPALGLEAFVLHTRNASLVTVGQFDGPNDPELLRTKAMLEKITPRVTEDPTGLKPVTNAQSIFGNLIPMPIPRP